MENDSDHDENSTVPEPTPENTLEVVEELYRKVNQRLDVLDDKLQAACENQEHQWDNQVRAAKPKETGDEHLIGIIGATGAGKSALLNAILDEECLVPTSCMQACTAAVIEVAYNRSSHHDYRAVIEFVSREMWRAEISTLLKDTTSSAAEDFDDGASEAAVALAKLSAVYPDFNRKSLSKFTVDELIGRPGLGVLGTSREIVATSGLELYTELRKYVESKEKLQYKNSSNALYDTEHWPLIRKVRIFTKAAVLKTGCVLVDLPGVADVNAARASIAQQYLANCASLWIVVPITRAVDDQVGRHLLGERFKRQMRRDGTLGRVAFICSKADLGFAHELRGHFKSDDIFMAQMAEMEPDRQEVAKQKTEINKDIKKAERTLKSILDQIKSLQLEYNAYAKLYEMKKKGFSVHPPTFRKPKRKATKKESLPRKQTKLGAFLSSSDAKSYSATVRGNATSLSPGDVSEEQDFDVNDVDQDTSQPAMGTTELQTKLDTIGGFLRELQATQKDNDNNIAQQRSKLEMIITLLAEQEWDACYEARNRYVSKHLRSDFKLGIRDLERAEIEEDADFDPKAEVPKSIEEQTDLPVFCTASQSFQKLRGRLEDDRVSDKLTDIDQTGIPDLMKYCIDIGAKDIVATRAMYTNLVSILLTSVRFWLSREDGLSVVQPAGTQTIQELTEQLIKDIAKTIDRASTKIESEVTHVAERLTKAAKAGEKKALAIVRAWGAPLTSDKPGLHHQTYRAVLRRGGVYTRPGREIDWIGELLGPMMRSIDGRWNRTFNECIPAILIDAKKSCFRLIDDYLATLGQNYEFFVAPGDVRVMFRSQFERLKSTLRRVVDTAGQTISQDQANANRVFDKAVSYILEPLFTELGEDSGNGVFLRNKNKLEKEMLVFKSRIFSGAANQVFRTLQTSLDKSRQSMLESLRKSFETPRQDCLNLFAKLSITHDGVSKESQLSILETIREIEGLLGIDTDAVELETYSVKAETNEIKVEVNSQVNDGADPIVSNAIHVKYETSTQLAEEIMPVPHSMAIASDETVRSNEAENEQVLVDVGVAEGSGNDKDKHDANVQDDRGNIASVTNEVIGTSQGTSDTTVITADVDLHVPLAEYEDVPLWSFEVADASH